MNNYTNDQMIYIGVFIAILALIVHVLNNMDRKAASKRPANYYTPFEQGKRAAARGGDIYDNSYEPGGLEFNEWVEGFNQYHDTKSTVATQ